MLALAAVLAAAAGTPHNAAPGTAPDGFDCALAQLQLDFAARAQPFRRHEDFVALADALQLTDGRCPPPKLPPPAREGARSWPRSGADGPAAALSRARIVVDCSSGDDGAAGTSDSPLRSLGAAVLAARGTDGPVDIEVHGICFLSETLHLNASDTGLSIRGGSGATLVGGQQLQFSGPWRRSSSRRSNHSTAGTLWERSLATGASFAAPARALRFGAGEAAILARYPNSNPYTDIFPVGWIRSGGQWLPPNLTSTGPTLSAIESRPQYVRNDTLGIQDRWMVGVGGRCGDMSPPAGYWCIDDPSGWMGAGDVHRHPAGLTYYNQNDAHTTSLLPNAPYADPSVARVTAFGTGDHWFTWCWDQISERVDALGNHTLLFGRGGNQGAEGFDSAAEWYIEGPLEELDAPLEFAIANSTLYFMANGTGPPATDAGFGWVVPSLVTMINISGSPANPVRNISLQDLTIRDAADGWFTPHNMPSGGDWYVFPKRSVHNADSKPWRVHISSGRSQGWVRCSCKGRRVF